MGDTISMYTTYLAVGGRREWVCSGSYLKGFEGPGLDDLICAKALLAAGSGQ